LSQDHAVQRTPALTHYPSSVNDAVTLDAANCVVRSHDWLLGVRTLSALMSDVAIPDTFATTAQPSACHSEYHPHRRARASSAALSVASVDKPFAGTLGKRAEGRSTGLSLFMMIP
jgi:hypothetical protein